MSKTLATHKVAAVLVGLGLVAAIMFAFAPVAKAQTVAELQAQINSLLATIAALQTQITAAGGGTTGASTGFTFTRNHSMGDSGGEVMELQKFLNTMADTQVSASGAGSPGNESSYFGSKTKAAVVKYQNKYAADILTPLGLTAGSGYWGAATRAKANAMNAGGTTGGTTTGGTTPTGAGVFVTAAAQPANNLAPNSASRVPFTKFVLTNNSGAEVTVNGITVERTGLASDSVFSGIVLVDADNNVQIGTAKTLNSNHQAVIGDAFKLAAGTSKTFTVAGNMAASLTSYAGQVVGITVVAVASDGTVTGSLPITGASHTVNSTLTIGTVSTTTSSFDPGAAQSKNLGDTKVRISGLRFTAGSAEDLKLFSVRWRQVGTASAADLANVMTVIDSTEYPTTISADGKYYTTVFAGGLSVPKGTSIDLWNVADFVGTNAAARTVDFDIDKVTDIYFVGQTYNFGIAPSGTYQPWFTGYVTTINAGTVTTIGKANQVPAGNIAANVPNQILGGFVTEFKGESVSVTSLPITIATSSAMGGVITSISLYDDTGKVVAGPLDEASTCTTGCTVTFTDTVTFPTGKKVWTVKGKLPSSTSNNTTVIVSTDPSAWSGVTGATSGNTVSITTANFAMNTMTVKAAAVKISLSSTPASQNIVGGAQGAHLANLQIDATQSGEDVRISSVPIILTLTTMVIGELTSCQVFDGATALNTGGNVVALAASGSATTYTFDNTMTIAKGTVKTIAMKCNVSSAVSASDSVVGSISTAAANWTTTGVTSGVSITETFGNATGGTMTVAAGALAVTTDPLSPAYTIASAGSTGVTLGVYKFTATNEDVYLDNIGINLGTVTASSSAADLATVSFWAPISGVSTQIATAEITGTARSGTSTAISGVMVPKDGYLAVTVKGNLTAHSVSSGANFGGLITMNVDVAGATGLKNTTGTGAASGTTIDPTGSTAVSGVRVFKSYPTVARSTTGMAATLIAQSGIDLYRFTISAAPTGPVGLSQLSINVATSTVSTTNGTTSVTNLKVYAYTGSDFQTGPVSGFTAGQVVATVAGLVSNGNNTATLSSVLTIPAGTTYYFRVVGDVAQVAGSTGSAGSVTTKLSGDTAYPNFVTNLLGSSTGVISGFGNTGLFVWSPMSTSSTLSNTNLDWTNSFNVPGISSGNTDSWTLSK